LLFNIDRCAIEHPYHTIPIVYAVANSNLDLKYTKHEKSSTNKEEVKYIFMIFNNLNLIKKLIKYIFYVYSLEFQLLKI